MLICTMNSGVLLASICLLGALLGQGTGQLSPAAPARGGLQAAPRQVDPAITRGDLQAAVVWLAADERKGRSTGSPEQLEAARWLAAGLEAAGIEPGGDQGFLQCIPLGRVEFSGPPELALERKGESPRAAVWGVDFDSISAPAEEAALELVVVRGLSDLPERSSTDKALFLDARGGELRELSLAAREGWGLVIQRGSSRPGRSARSEPPGSVRARPGSPVVRVRGPLADELAAAPGALLRFRAPGRVEERPAFNVVGILRGAGTAERPELASEVVVLSAHYDHLGVREDAGEGEDAVYNGADDDASGCAAVLELAEALAAGPAPARTVVFLFATGEEIGMVGTKHYLEQPPLPLEQTVANLNFEMVGRPDALAGGPGKLWLTGWERTNLGPAFAAAGLVAVPDPRPEQAFFQRSDNYAFALRGIVAQTLSSYDLHQDYHGVGDEASKLDFAHMEAAVRDALAGVRALVEGAIDPAWEPGGAPGE